MFRSAEEMSRLAPFVDAAAAIDRTVVGQHVHLVLHLRRGDRPGARSVAARSIERPDVARYLHEGAMGAARPAGAEGSREWSRHRTRWTTSRTCSSKCQRRPRLRDGVLRELHPGPRCRRLRRAARARRIGPAQAQSRDRDARAGATHVLGRRRARQRRRHDRLAALQGRHRSRRSDRLDRRHARHHAGRAQPDAGPAASPARSCPSASSAAAARPSTARSCSTRTRTSRSCRSNRPAARSTEAQKRFRDDWLGSKQ